MTCKICKKPVPDGQIACSCFILRAQKERAALAIARFKAREALLFERDGHVFPERKNTDSLCGRVSIKHHDEKKTETLHPNYFDLSSVPLTPSGREIDIECPECKRLTSDVVNVNT